jgi:type IV secretory pathway VirB10-like protein
MPFSTTSYLAGVGTVAAALALGFSGGFFLAPADEHVVQNRLQRIMLSAPASGTAAPTAGAPKPESVAIAAAGPAPAVVQQVVAEKALPLHPPVMAKASEPVRTEADERDALATSRAAELDKARAEAKAERKRAQARKLAERRKQREIEKATIAVKRMMQDREPQQVAAGEVRFGFFGQD